MKVCPHCYHMQEEFPNIPEGYRFYRGLVCNPTKQHIIGGNREDLAEELKDSHTILISEGGGYFIILADTRKGMNSDTAL